MKKIGFLSLFVILFALIFGTLANAQTPTRIQFAKGKSSTVVKGFTGDAGAHYVIRAKSGQKLILNLTPASKVGIKVETEGQYGHMVLLREEKGGYYEIGLEETGDYTIFIGSLDHKPVQFTLSVRTGKLTDI